MNQGSLVLFRKKISWPIIRIKMPKQGPPSPHPGVMAQICDDYQGASPQMNLGCYIVVTMGLEYKENPLT